MISREEIFQRISLTLQEALHRDENEITMKSTIMEDLGAHSIDFLDIVFRLEREFGIRIPRGELFPESIFQGDPDFVNSTGKITDKGLKYLQQRFPWADISQLARESDGYTYTSSLSDLFTVEFLVNYIESRLQK